jgi:hypothetical protein
VTREGRQGRQGNPCTDKVKILRSAPEQAFNPLGRHRNLFLTVLPSKIKIQKIALFGKRPSPYYGKNESPSLLKHFKNFEGFFKCSHKNHQAL